VSRTSRAAAARNTIDRPSRRHPGPRIRIVGTDEIAAALDSAGLRSDRALIVLVGGAGGMRREGVRDRGPGAAGRGRARRRAPGCRRDRR
jgi:hypothetical protein